LHDGGCELDLAASTTSRIASMTRGRLIQHDVVAAVTETMCITFEERVARWSWC